MNLRRLLWTGGVAAGVLLVALGGLWIFLGIDSRSEVQDTISREQIEGTPDMSRATFEGEPPEGVELPTCDVAGETITTGAEARCFAEWMRIHALEGTGGKTFAEMGRFLDEEGNDVFSEAEAATDPETGQPVTNPQRDLWVNQRALATGLELAFVGEQVSLFSIATGVVFAIIGIGFLVMLTAGGVLAGRATGGTPGGSGGPSA